MALASYKLERRRIVEGAFCPEERAKRGRATGVEVGSEEFEINALVSSVSHSSFGSLTGEKVNDLDGGIYDAGVTKECPSNGTSEEPVES